MNLYDKSSLILVPGAVKDGKVYSQRPENGDGDFTFTRASSATRVNSDGLIEKGRENLLLQSNQFDTTWVNANSVETSGQTGYDGSSDAWLLTKTGVSGRITQTISVSGVFTYSIYAKADTSNWILLYKTGTGEGGRFFDLENGVIGSSIATAPIDSKIESIGNGWYRCSIVGNSATAAVVYVADSNGSATGSSGSIYIQDAQLEVGLVATDYIETTTTTAVSGITEDLPRLDYSGGASCPSLLLEPTRTNLIAFSENYGIGQWANTDVNLTTNYSLSPEGQMNASLWEFATTNTLARIQYVMNGLTIGATYTQSYYIKSLSGDLTLRIGTSGAIVGEFEDITATSEWQRFDFTSVASGTTEYPRIQNITGTQGAQILVYGAQFELGSYRTSYIPTYGSAVTRSNDSCNLLNLVSQGIIADATQWTIFYELDVVLDKPAGGASQFINGNGTLDVYSRYGAENNTFARVYWRADSKYIASSSYGKKICARLSDGIGSVFYNGSLAGSDTITGDYSGINIISNTSSVGGLITQILIFPTALTDSECIALTTL